MTPSNHDENQPPQEAINTLAQRIEQLERLRADQDRAPLWARKLEDRFSNIEVLIRGNGSGVSINEKITRLEERMQALMSLDKTQRHDQEKVTDLAQENAKKIANLTGRVALAAGAVTILINVIHILVTWLIAYGGS